MLLVKTKFSTIEVLISKALIDSNIRHDKFISVNKVLREYNEIKEEKILKLPSISYRKSIEPIASVVKNILETKIQVLENKRTKEQNRLTLLLFVARKNGLSLKIKNSTVLIIFQMISLKLIKSLTNFYCLGTNLWRNSI